MTETDYQRYWKRVARYGFTPEEAFACPRRKPLWMFRVEQEEGVAFAEFIRRELRCRVSLRQIALSIGVHKDTLYHHVRKLRRQGVL